MKSKVRTEYIGGLPVDVLTHQEIMDDLESYLKAKEKMIVTSVNPQISLLAFEHPEVKLYLKRATHRIADGIGVVKASKLMGGSIRERVTGIDVMDNFLEYANQHKERIFLYGAKQEVVEAAAKNIQRQYPGIVISGILHGYTKKKQQEIVEQINKAEPRFVFVALGSPKQEIFLEQTIDHLRANVFLDVGGTFDVLAGSVKRAPEFYINHNLEWLYRCLTIKRYDRLMQIPKYIYLTIKYRNNKSRGQ